jgi:putative endonuclease
MAGLVPATHELDRAAMVPRDRFRLFIAVYMMASRKYGTIYTGVTSQLPGRFWEHREGLLSGFTRKYNVRRLVWYECHETMEAAIRRETAIKKYKREWKINLIERDNPDWTISTRIFDRGDPGWPGRAPLRYAPPGHDG